MAQSISHLPYIVREDDTLASIARQTYGNENLWHEIYLANSELIGNDPHRLAPGTTLSILANPRQAQTYLDTQYCTVIVDSLNVRTRPTTGSAVVSCYPQGTVLNFDWIEDGEVIDGNPLWGHSQQGHYYWMGGTDRPQG